MDFPDLKKKTSDWLFRSKLMSHACEHWAWFICRLANHNEGLSSFSVYSSYIWPQSLVSCTRKQKIAFRIRQVQKKKTTDNHKLVQGQCTQQTKPTSHPCTHTTPQHTHTHHTPHTHREQVNWRNLQKRVEGGEIQTYPSENMFCPRRLTFLRLVKETKIHTNLHPRILFENVLLTLVSV